MVDWLAAWLDNPANPGVMLYHEVGYCCDFSSINFHIIQFDGANCMNIFLFIRGGAGHNVYGSQVLRIIVRYYFFI